MKSTTIVLMMAYLSLTGLHAQSADGLDFLDKVENIEIPKDEIPPKQSTSPSNTTKKESTSKPKTVAPKKETTATKPTPTIKPKPVQPKPVVKEVPKVTEPKPTATRTTTVQKPIQTNTEPPVDKSLPADPVPNTQQVWIDHPLDMEPNYLMGFEKLSGDNTKQEKSDEKSEKELNPTVHPLPHLDGDFSIWASLMEFLSKYQKAFYIFGILLLFAIYRLKMGKNGSSSRKTTPTIRRMRR